MSAHSAEAERAILLEERAHQLRLVMFKTPGLLERVDEGAAAAERGEIVTLEELDRELGWND